MDARKNLKNFPELVVCMILENFLALMAFDNSASAVSGALNE
jgi:hypothetical protein